MKVRTSSLSPYPGAQGTFVVDDVADLVEGDVVTVRGVAKYVVRYIDGSSGALTVVAVGPQSIPVPARQLLIPAGADVIKSATPLPGIVQLVGTSGAGLTYYFISDTDVSLAVDTSSTQAWAISVIPGPTALDGARFSIYDYTGNAASNAIQVLGSGGIGFYQKGSATPSGSLTLNTSFAFVNYRFSADHSIWFPEY